MVSEAEKHKQEDELVRKRVEAKNQYESTIFQMKSLVSDTSSKEGMESAKEDISKINTVLNEHSEWLSDHPNEKAEIYEQRMKELQESSQRLFSNLQNNSNNPSSNSQFNGSGPSSGPTVEELD